MDDMEIFERELEGLKQVSLWPPQLREIKLVFVGVKSSTIVAENVDYDIKIWRTNNTSVR